MSAAEAAADMTISLILNPERAARLVQYHAENQDNPDLREVISNLIQATWGRVHDTGLQLEVVRAVDYVVAMRLMSLALDLSAPAEVRSIATDGVEQLKGAASHDRYVFRLIDTFERDPESLELPKPAEPPPGQPIGDDEDVSGFSVSQSQRR